MYEEANFFLLQVKPFFSIKKFQGMVDSLMEFPICHFNISSNNLKLILEVIKKHINYQCNVEVKILIRCVEIDPDFLNAFLIITMKVFCMNNMCISLRLSKYFTKPTVFHVVLLQDH